MKTKSIASDSGPCRAAAGSRRVAPGTSARPTSSVRSVRAERPAIAVADMRGTGDAQRNMDTFNSTLWDELAKRRHFEDGGQERVPARSPAAPAGFQAAHCSCQRAPRNAACTQRPWLTDWSGPPVSANYLAFGYTAVQDNRLVLFGWLFNTGQPDVDQRPGDRQTVLRLARRRRREESRARFRRRHPAAVRRQEPGRHQDLFRFRPQRQPKKSGPWTTTARTSSA